MSSLRLGHAWAWNNARDPWPMAYLWAGGESALRLYADLTATHRISVPDNVQRMRRAMEHRVVERVHRLGVPDTRCMHRQTSGRLMIWQYLDPSMNG
eukprot:3938588-Rhodomonas_salina.1